MAPDLLPGSPSINRLSVIIKSPRSSPQAAALYREQEQRRSAQFPEDPGRPVVELQRRSELEALYSVYFDGPSFRDKFEEGYGSDLLYIAYVIIEEPYEGRNIDLAVVRRLLDTLGQGCVLAVIPYESKAENCYWARMGFQASKHRTSRGLMHLHQAYPQPQIVDPDDTGSFQIVPVNAGEKRAAHH